MVVVKDGNKVTRCCVIRDSDDDDPRPFVMLANERSFARDPLADAGSVAVFRTREAAHAAALRIPIASWMTFPGRHGYRVLSTNLIGLPD